MGQTDTLHLSACVIENNHSTAEGGGIDNRGTTDITDCRLSGNSSVLGGGIYNLGSLNLCNTVLDFKDSTIGPDKTAGNGGRIDNFCELMVVNSTITGNTAISNGDAGGLFNRSGANAIITMTTISQNQADGNGGGIFNLGSLLLSHSTIGPGNSAYDTVGGMSQSFISNSYLLVGNSALSGNSADIGAGIFRWGQRGLPE